MDYPNFVFDLPDLNSRAIRRTVQLWRIGRFVSRVPFLPSLVHLVASVLPRLSLGARVLSRAVTSERKVRARAAAEVERGSQKKIGATAFGSGYGYDDPEEELAVTTEYERQIKTGKEWQLESGHVYAISLDVCCNCIEKNNIKTVLNFGVSYAYVDSILAKRYPDTEFIGLDRAEATKRYNEERFNLANLHFVADDIITFLEKDQTDDRRKLFLHIRTTALLPQDFIRELYAAVHKAGYSDIIGVEPCGMSRDNFGLMEMSSADRTSLPFRAGMLLHNYQGLLERAGFSLTRNRYLVTNHGDPDYRLQVIEAVRR